MRTLAISMLQKKRKEFLLLYAFFIAFDCALWYNDSASNWHKKRTSTILWRVCRCSFPIDWVHGNVPFQFSYIITELNSFVNKNAPQYVVESPDFPAFDNNRPVYPLPNFHGKGVTGYVIFSDRHIIVYYR